MMQSVCEWAVELEECREEARVDIKRARARESREEWMDLLIQRPKLSAVRSLLLDGELVEAAAGRL